MAIETETAAQTENPLAIADTAGSDGMQPVREPDKRMSFFDHLDELRKRLTFIAIAVFVGAGLAWLVVGQIFDLLRDPLPDGMKLYFGTPMAAFSAKIKISLFVGAVFTSPLIIYQMLAFLGPAFSRKEKKFLYPVLAAGLVLATAGIVAGYTYIFPIGIQWLVGQGVDVELNPILMVDAYVSFAGWFLLGLGLAAETPLILLAAIKFNIVTPEQLKKNWRVVYIVILLAAAIMTPDWSPVTMVAVAGPMAVLYHGTLIFARFVKPREARA